MSDVDQTRDAASERDRRDIGMVRTALFELDDAHSRTELSPGHHALDRLEAALADARSGFRYIETRYGRLDGVGWDRVL